MNTYKVEAERPFAVDSPDHIAPWGAWHDDNTHAGLVREIKQAGVTSVLDLGCAQGRFVRDLAESGVAAFGLDGCGWLTKNAKNWLERPELYGSADLSRDWGVSGQFDLITSWEFLEHLPTDRVQGFLICVKEHMSSWDSLFVGTVALVPDTHNGHEYHQTVKPFSWWEEQFDAAGLRRTGYPFRNALRNEAASERFALRLK